MLRLAIGVIIGLIAAAIVRSKGQNANAGQSGRHQVPSAESKKCPYCAESLQRDAAVCHSCGSVLAGNG